MNKNDQSLMRQMLKAGRFNYEIYELLCKYNTQRSKEMVKKMGDKWCCHPSNAVKRLAIPLEILKMNQSKILRK